MNEVSSKEVAALRNKTGLGMMDCKRALEAAEGDFEKAIDYLRKKGIAKGAARSERATGQGVIHAYIHPGDKIGTLLELRCETDFVARSEDFRQLAHNLAMQVAAAAPIAVRREDIPREMVERELEIYREQIQDLKKPPEIIYKIAAGKLEKFYQDSCLLEQPYIRDASVKVNDLILQASGKLKENIQVARFSRFVIGV